jgi:hypothetical protein
MTLAGLTTGCGEDVPEEGPNPCDEQKPTGDAGDGDHQIEVTMPDGSVESVWIHAVSPPGDGPFPVVIFAPGQDNYHAVNCSPDGTPPFDTGVAQSLAGLGYLTVMVGFRNHGAGAPGLGTLRLRDHYIYDARAFLAAAQWARLEHGKGTRNMAFIGHGLGTLPAMWAATKLTGLEDLQSCVAPRTMILAGGSANLVDWGNVTDEYFQITDPNIRLRVSLQGIESLMLMALSGHMRALGMAGETYAVKDIPLNDVSIGPLFDALFEDLTVSAGQTNPPLGGGMELLRVLGFNGPETAAIGCSSVQGLPPLCTLDCAEGAARLYVNFQEELFFDLSRWATAHGIGSIGWWEPPAKTTPVDSDMGTSVLLRAQHDASPAYAATGLSTKRALHLLAPGDPNNRPEAQQVLVDKLSSLGAAVNAPAIADAMGGMCVHESYFDPARGGCGWTHLLTELGEALPATPP